MTTTKLGATTIAHQNHERALDAPITYIDNHLERYTGQPITIELTISPVLHSVSVSSITPGTLNVPNTSGAISATTSITTTGHNLTASRYDQLVNELISLYEVAGWTVERVDVFGVKSLRFS